MTSASPATPEAPETPPVPEPGKEKVTYVKLDADKAARIVVDHIVNGSVVTDYTIGAANAAK